MEIIFLHGFGADHHVFDNYFSLPYEKRFFDIHFDEFSKPILPEINKETLLVGWSMGGMISLEILKLYPNKIKGLILISSSPSYISTDIFPEGKDLTVLKDLRNSILNNDPKAMQNFQRQLFSIKEIKDGFLQKFRKELGSKIKVSKEDLIHGLNFLENFRADKSVKQVKTIVLQGTDDYIINPKAVDAWKKIFPDAESILFEAGHAISFVKPEIVIDAIKKFV